MLPINCCPDCGAIDSCCKTSQARLETANGLQRLVERQAALIETLKKIKGQA